jgi:diguanylate cyclase (GGDEF)-like protein/PAS domain S-box-containing protein
MTMNYKALGTQHDGAAVASTLAAVSTLHAVQAGATDTGSDTRTFPGLLSQIIGKSPIGIVVIDYDGRIQSVNPAYCEIYGYAHDALIGQPYTMIFPPNEQAGMLARHQAFLRGEGEYRGEFIVQSSDGHSKAVLAESVAVHDASGQPLRLVYVVDIQEQKSAQHALDASRMFSQAVLDGLSAHVCVIDDTGTIVTVNQAWRDYASANGGTPEATGPGLNYLQLCEQAAQSPDEQCADATAFLQGLRDVLHGATEHFEHTYPCHAPTRSRWFMGRVSRMPVSGPARFVIAHDEVTSIQHLQEALIQREAFLSDLTQSSPGAVFRFEAPASGPMRIVYASRGVEPLLELTSREVCERGEVLLSLVTPEFLPAMISGLTKLRSWRAPWSQEFQIKTASGQLKWIAGHATVREDAHGTAIWTGLLQDISARKQTEDRLCQSEARYRTLFETVPQGIVYQDPNGHITSANEAAQRILGLTLDQLQGRTSIDERWRAVRADGSDLPGHDHPAMLALRTGAPVRDAVMGVVTGSERCAWLRVSAIPVFEDGRLKEVYSSFEDITAQQQLNDELRMLATTDALTGLANRRTVRERSDIEFQRIRRKPSLRCAVLAVDIDHFKRVNDTLGHAAGDTVLREVAERLRGELRTTDVVGRVGGEEFMVLLPDTLPEHALLLAQRMRARIASTPIDADGQPVRVTVSIGVSTIDHTDASVEEVFARADQALYLAKHSGRDAVRFEPGAGANCPVSEVVQVAEPQMHKPLAASRARGVVMPAPARARAPKGPRNAVAPRANTGHRLKGPA